jgi:ATP-binding cassette subfamily B protein
VGTKWWGIVRLVPVAGRVAVVATMLNLVIGVLPLGFVIGTSVAVERVTGTGPGVWGGVLLAVGPAVAALLLQAVLSPFQAAFTELISRRVDGVCARRLMRTTLTEAPVDLLEQPDVLDKMGDARRGLVAYSTTPGAAVAGLIALIARYAQLAGAIVLVGIILNPRAGSVIAAAALVARFGERGAQTRYSLLRSRGGGRAVTGTPIPTCARCGAPAAGSASRRSRRTASWCWRGA